MLLIIVLMLGSLPRTDTAAPPVCAYNDRVLDLGFEAFDQAAKGGWRELSEKHGCEDEAADLVRDYRQKYQSIMPLLYWHEAQIRALTGHYREAVLLMRKSRKPSLNDASGWNPYVDATIAFLEKDRNGLLKARARLGRLKKPSDWPNDVEWPQNTTIVAGLVNCFGRSYKVAYSESCQLGAK